MAAATAIISIDRPRGQIQQIGFSLTAGAIGAAATEVETIAVPGAAVGDAIIITPPAAGVQTGLIITQARVSAAGVVSFHITNITAGALTPTAGAGWICTLIRGTTMTFAR